MANGEKNEAALLAKTQAPTNFSRETFNAVGIRAIKWTVAEMASAAHKTLNPADHASETGEGSKGRQFRFQNIRTGEAIQVPKWMQSVITLPLFEALVEDFSFK